MRRTIILYGAAMAVLISLLKLVEYRYFVHDIPLEFYIGLVAIMFTSIGVWAGLRLTRPKIVKVVTDSFELDSVFSVVISSVAKKCTERLWPATEADTISDRNLASMILRSSDRCVRILLYVSKSKICSVSNRIPAHRFGPHRALQLSLRPQDRR